MPRIPLPKRTGPRHGDFAFTPKGERQIYDAHHAHGMPKIKIAAAVGCSLPTVDAILKRVADRIKGAASEDNGAEPLR